MRVELLTERLFKIFSHRPFLGMKGLANEVPIYIQAYSPADEDAIRRMVDALTNRLSHQGIIVKSLDLLDIVLRKLREEGLLDELLAGEASYEKIDLLDTLQNHSNPKTHLVPRLVEAIGNSDTQLTLVTGSGRVYPFLRTHSILESLQPAMFRHPVVFFFPGEYIQEPSGGSHLRLFGSIPSPRINNPYYRAANLDHYII